MTTIELQALLDRVKDEIRIFERPSADNSRKMFELLTEAVKNNGVLPLVSKSLKCDCKHSGNCRYESVIVETKELCRHKE